MDTEAEDDDPAAAAHPEVPRRTNYCLDCPHWGRTERGARCALLNREDVNLCPHHLIWDGGKECGISLRPLPAGMARRQGAQVPPGAELRKEVCPCGVEVEVTYFHRKPEPGGG